MITETSKVYLPLVVLGTLAAGVYARFNGDHVGIFLFVVLAMVGLLGAVSLATARDRPEVLAEEADRPAVAVVVAPALPGGWIWPALAAAGAGLVVLAPILGSIVGGAGASVALVAAVGWGLRASGDRTGRVPNMMPLGIPVAGLAVIASIMYLLSRVLLAVPEAMATTLALLVAVAIMVVATLFVAKPNLSPQTIVAALAVAAVVMTGGGLVAAQVGEREIEHHGESEEHGAGGAEEHGDSVQLSARDVAFSVTEIEFAAGAEVSIVFENTEALAHNVAVYADAAGSEAIFQGSIFTGPATMTYTFTAPGPGEYFFRCDVHPQTMRGTVRVV